MPVYRISGTAQTSSWLGEVSPLDQAVADEGAVEIEQGVRTDDGVDFILRVTAADSSEAHTIAQRCADRLSPGSAVTVLERAAS